MSCVSRPEGCGRPDRSMRLHETSGQVPGTQHQCRAADRRSETDLGSFCDASGCAMTGAVCMIKRKCLDIAPQSTGRNGWACLPTADVAGLRLFERRRRQHRQQVEFGKRGCRQVRSRRQDGLHPVANQREAQQQLRPLEPARMLFAALHPRWPVAKSVTGLSASAARSRAHSGMQKQDKIQNETKDTTCSAGAASRTTSASAAQAPTRSSSCRVQG